MGISGQTLLKSIAKFSSSFELLLIPLIIFLSTKIYNSRVLPPLKG